MWERSMLRLYKLPNPFEIRISAWLASDLRHIDPLIVHLYAHYVRREIGDGGTIVVEQV